MSYLLDHWSFGPYLIIAIILAGWHEIGLARLDRDADPGQTRRRRLRSLWFYGGLATALIAIESPIGYWANDYFFMHITQHLLLMFAAPMLVVAGAPWQPLLGGLPGRAGRSAIARVLGGGWSRPLRAAGGWLLRPWVSIAAFNIVMLAWHIPALLDLEVNSQAVRIWLMYPSFFIVGVLFWLQLIPSPPFRMRMPATSQAMALVATNVIMWILAMSMGILTQSSWYPVYSHVPGVTLAPFADQQIGAGILWVCGDFWAIPCLIVVVRRIIAQEGSMSTAFDRMLSRRTSGAEWASRAPRA
jgi:putative membrane protein